MSVAELIDRTTLPRRTPAVPERTQIIGKRTFLLVAAVLVVLLLLKAALFFAAGQPPLYLDALGYWHLGKQMSLGDVWLWTNPAAYRTPGYPALLALCQATFGDYALIAAAALQQLATVAIAVLTGWICGRLSGLRAGVLLGLAISLCCISRNCIAAYFLSDILFCLTLTLLLLGLVAWFDRPSLRWAVAIGLLLGAGILIKPLVQFAWMPLLAAMALRLYQQNCLRSIWKHGACVVLAIAVLVGPWCLRNQLLFGQPFLTRSLGRQLWDASLAGETSRNRLCPMPLPFADGPNTARLLEELRGHDVDPRETFHVFGELRKIGYGELEADALMQAAAVEAIRRQPWRFAQTRVYWSFLYWITPAEILCWQPDNAVRGEFSPGLPLPPGEPCSYLGQRTWYSPRLSAWHHALMQVCWQPSRWLYAVAAMATFWGWIALLRIPERRALAVALGLLMLYFTLTVALFAPPVYRYRMALEPIMIVIVGTAWLETAWARRLFAGAVNDPGRMTLHPS
jgi:4-amino-4-deoxy-L-arabinose transferase-like glycosyltransferase